MNKELIGKVDTAIERLKNFESKDGYYLAFSGGKDSVVIKALADLAGVKYDAHYRVTSVDPPELVRFVKSFDDVSFDVPRDGYGDPITMWNLIPKKLYPPTRIARYCCEKLKEDGGDGRKVITGVRWAESTNRKNNQGLVTLMSPKKAVRDIAEEYDEAIFTEKGGVVLNNDNDESRELVELCYTRCKTTINPIIDWADSDVWEFIRDKNIRYCSLYDEGCKRLGCIGCPMANTHGREKEFARWPKYKKAYLMAFERMLKVRQERGLNNGKMGNTPESVYHWWMEDRVLPGQMNLFTED